MLNNPNTIVLGYHGPSNSSDPYRNFNGNNIITLMGFSSYPTGICDRLTVPQSRGAWAGQVANRAVAPPKVSIEGTINFEADTNRINIHLVIKALASIPEIPVINFVLTEDKLISTQTGNTSCPGNGDYTHNNVVRSMLNGALGSELAKTGWNAGDSAVVDTFFYVPTNITKISNTYLNTFVYSKKNPLNTSEIHQARKWKVIDNILPVEIQSITAHTDGEQIILSWETVTETNNFGFFIQSSENQENWVDRGFIAGYGNSISNQKYEFTFNLKDKRARWIRLRQVDFDGTEEYTQAIEIKALPSEFTLDQNYPNPFNPETRINFAVPKPGFVSLKVYDLLGKEVAVIVNGELASGNYSRVFNAADLPSGVYVYRLEAEGTSISRKMNLLK